MKKVKFQALYKKNRKKSYDSLYNNNSLGNELTSDSVFAFWKHLLCHTSITEPDPSKLVYNEVPIHFEPDDLIYIEEIRATNPKNKSAAGLDGLTVYDIT